MNLNFRLSLVFSLAVLLWGCVGEAPPEAEDQGGEDTAEVENDLGQDLDPDQDLADGLDGDSTDLSDQEDDGDALEEDSEEVVSLVVAITPSSPGTLDDLGVQIVEDSTFPSGTSYTYRWLLEGTERASTEILGHEQTSKGESWVVEVTPHSGSETGPSATAEVVIGNTLPELGGAGLDNYAPHVGFEVRVISGQPTDADGDATGKSYYWHHNGEVIEGEVTSSLTLSPELWSAGDKLSVEVRPRDATGEGEGTLLGPVSVYRAGPHWQAISPNLSLGEGFGVGLVHDKANHRLLYMMDNQLWEMVLDAEDRWVRLNTHFGEANEAMPQTFSTVSFLDEDNQRLLFYAVKNTGSVSEWEGAFFSVDLSVRGQEHIQELKSVLGEEVPMVIYANGFQDHVRGFVFLGGGMTIQDGESLNTDYWVFDYHDPGNETLSLVTIEGTMPAFVFPFWLHLDGVDKSYWTGGYSIADETYNTVVYQLEWIMGTDGIQANVEPVPGTELPGKNMSMGINTPVTEDNAHLVVFNDSSSSLVNFDWNAQLFSVIDAASPMMSLLLLVADEVSGDLYFMRFAERDINDNDVTGASLFHYEVGEESWRPLMVYGETQPAAIENSMGTVYNDEFYVLTGEFSNEASNEAYFYDFANQLWEHLEIEPDAVAGVPAQRYGASSILQSSYRQVFFGGYGNSEYFNDAWELLESSGSYRWDRLVASTSAGPVARRDAQVWYPACGGTVMTVYGGRSSSGQLEDIWELNCSSTSCTWEQQQVTGQKRQLAPVVPFPVESSVLLYGGIDDGYDTMESLSSFPRCLNSTSSEKTYSTNMSPGPRVGHAFVFDQRTQSELPDQNRFYLFGGSSSSINSRDEYNNDVWRLDYLGGEFTWTQLEVTGPRPLPSAGFVFGWDGEKDGFLVAGGKNQYRTTSEVWAFYPGPLE